MSACVLCIVYYCCRRVRPAGGVGGQLAVFCLFRFLLLPRASMHVAGLASSIIIVQILFRDELLSN